MSGHRSLHEELLLIDDQILIIGRHNLAGSCITLKGERSVCIQDEDLCRQAEALCWQRGKLASGPDPNTWKLSKPLALTFGA